MLQPRYIENKNSGRKYFVGKFTGNIKLNIQNNCFKKLAPFSASAH